MLIGIIGYFTVPTVAGWIVQAGGAGNFSRNLNRTATKAGGFAAGAGGAVLGNIGEDCGANKALWQPVSVSRQLGLPGWRLVGRSRPVIPETFIYSFKPIIR